MKQYGWILSALYRMKEARTKRLYIVWLDLLQKIFLENCKEFKTFMDTGQVTIKGQPEEKFEVMVLFDIGL